MYNWFLKTTWKHKRFYNVGTCTMKDFVCSQGIKKYELS